YGILLILSFMLVGCLNTPGTYMGPADVNVPLKVGKQRIYPKLIAIEPNLFPGPVQLRGGYHVGPQDILNIIVWNHPELTIPSMQTTSESVNFYNHASETANSPRGVLIDETGEIFFPLAGKFKVDNLTVDQIRRRLTKRLVRY